MKDAIDRLGRRMLKAISRGWKTTGIDTGTVQFMQVQLGPQELKDSVPRVAEFGFTSNPPIGSDVIALFIGGDRSNGVVVATGHQASRPTGLQPGETMIYSQDGKSIYMTKSGGIVVNANNQSVTVNNATTVTINAANVINLETPQVNVSQNLNVGANLTVTGNTTTATITVT
jgi:phage baseplate assembly protein V